MMDGLNFIRKTRSITPSSVPTFFNSVFGMSYLILMPVFARDVLTVGSQGFGFLQSAGGLGALCGVLAVAYFSNSRGKAGKPSEAPSYSVSCSFSLRSRSRIPSR